MADRYDEFERGSQGRRGDWREERGGQDRGDFGRDDWDFRNRNRGNWGGDQERYGRGEWGNDQYGRNQWGRDRYSEPYYSGQRNERDYEPHGSAWQRNNTTWGQRRSEEGPWGTGSQGFGTGYRSGEGGMGGYTGFGGGGSESYYGGAGTAAGYGQQRGSYRGSENMGGYSGGMSNYGSSGASGSESYSGGAANYGQQQRGRHSGKGPKGYQRSDDRIREDVCERLTNDGDIDATEIEVKVNNGEVTLSGIVDERYEKRMAEEIAENVSGVKDVHNQVRVHEHATAGTNQQSQTGSHQQTGSKELTGSQRR